MAERGAVVMEREASPAEAVRLARWAVVAASASGLSLLLGAVGIVALIAGHIGAKVATGRWRPRLADYPDWCLWAFFGGLAGALIGIGGAAAANALLRISGKLRKLRQNADAAGRGSTLSGRAEPVHRWRGRRE